MKSHDIQLLLFDLALILVLARVLGATARRFGQPPVLGEILAGILLGPTLFSGAITRHLFPMELRPPLVAVASLGLVLFMFIVGYELDGALIKGRERIAVSVSLGSIAVPVVAGFLLGVWLAHRHHVHRVVPFALFVGAAMSVTAFPVLARILTDRGMHRTRIGGLAIASAAVDDIVAWSLLAVVVTIASDHGSDQWHILLSPVYLAVMVFVVRPLMKQVAQAYRRQQRLTPDLLAIVLVGLLLSGCATEWMGVHFIFGAFIFGAVMPRADAEPLRQSILERLEQISVLLLLPVFFVVAGLAVDLSKIDFRAIVELLAILAVAIGGKFLGAYLGAQSAGVSGRQAGVLATLMNTRGLTEIVILTVGLQLRVLDTSLFSLMVLMALVTTAMTGPLLRVIYPPRLVERDILDAERAALSAANAYRVLVVIDPADTADEAALVDVALDLAGARHPAEVVLSRLVPQRPAARLELGSGLGSDLLVMTRTMSELHALAARGAARGIEVKSYSQFSEDLPGDLTRHVLTAEPDLVVLSPTTEFTPHDLFPRTVVYQAAGPAVPAVVAVYHRAGADGGAAIQVAAQIAVTKGLPLVLAGGQGRRDRGALSVLVKHGIDVQVGEVPAAALVVGSAVDADAHIVVHARRDDAVDSIDDWAGLVSAEGQA
ncbi:MAG: cation/H(+) antiporter [Pseudonocardiales bacterium]|nr:MAG: cation/H(+) antiporter [Pseudonocardiales bacterium]